ncbi:hypothetical protein SAMN02745753_02200 [Marinomonas polaris DSM 16579]|uniref:Uncharacterized protein n=1 Tax=Marinomonas polaris DSM 16579 TaxID=1122206 RepID=A0A1M5CP78_9GAMM|nr:hypothetical protein [Marinomonas polaris]SHF56510.1 hypothetical protein SAMN02745753_02200 [Marinomonas polaris DSM 16579]
MEYYSEAIKLLGGTTIVLAAFFGFVGKIWLSRIVEKNKSELTLELKRLEQELVASNKRLDADLQHSIFVSQVQFDKEYKIYGEVWEYLVELNVSTSQLRPVFDTINENQLEDDRKRERYNNFATPFNKFASTIEKNKPFFSLAVYQTLSDVRKACYNESVDYKHGKSSDQNYYKNSVENNREISALIDLACESIRFRLSEVIVK